MTTTTPSILGRAMLVQLNTSYWSARKKDDSVTEKVNAQYHADSDAGNYWKKLFGTKVDALRAVNSAVNRLRDVHRQETLPWTDDGWRLLPTTNYFQYTEAVRKAQRAYEEAVDAFVAEYPRLIRQAEQRLNGMFCRADYPSAANVRSRYKASLRYLPVPSADDFRVSLPSEELKQMAHSVEAEVGQRVTDAMRDAWSRLGEAVTHLRTRVDGDGKFLRDGMITRITQLADVLGRLNITNDPLLEEVRAQARRDLGSLSIDALRADDAARTEAVQKADAILAQMQGLWTPAATDEEDDK